METGIYTQTPDVSLIIPAYNEAARLSKTLEPILDYLRSQPHSFEVIVVDDGSRDGTAALVREHAARRPCLRLLQQPRNRGKGEAIRQGMLRGEGRYLFFSDADLSVPIETLSAFLSALEDGADVAIGSRQLGGATITVRQSPQREFMGRVYTLLTNRILGMRLSDFTCGFKGFRRTAAREIFARQRVRGWSFDAEVLYLARRRGYRIQELPVRWHNDPESKVRLWRDVATSFGGLLGIRANALLRRYR